jgi:acetyl-CoA acyltransferase
MVGNKPAGNPRVLEKRPETYSSMGLTAENVARRFNVSREDQDRFALESHNKALKAIESGRFKEQIVPVKTRYMDDEGKWVEWVHEVDEGPRASTLEALGKLRPVFDPTGSVTAGNSSQTNDAAAAVVIMGATKARQLGLEPMARFVDYTCVGVPPDIMGVGPLYAIRLLYKRNKLRPGDVDLYEINEAFASQALYCCRELGLDMERVNVNGGAIALGHPLGCTGAKLTTQLMYEMKYRGAKKGVVSMCIGGGMGFAALYERD